MSTYIFDIETPGLYRRTDKIHCIVAKDVDTREVHQFEPLYIRDGLQLLYSADMIIGHNICGFDIPVIQKLYTKWKPKKAYDTLVMSRLLDPDRPRHSIDSYGKQFHRSKPIHEDWSTYSPEMLHRCTEDTEINFLLYKYLEKKAGDWDWEPARLMEQKVAMIHLSQVLAGVDVDVALANTVVDKVDMELNSIDRELMEKIPKRYVSPYNNPVNKPFKIDGDYTQAVKKWFNMEDEDA